MVIRGKEFNEIYDLVGVRIMVDQRPRHVRGARRGPLAVEAGPRQVQGLRRDAQVEHVPVAAHDGASGPAACPWRSRSVPREMHRTAQFGIAAHWRYKEGAKQARDAADLALARAR